ncbi:MAG TPA: S-methyl-5-thioribose-1-phosphate isomerase [Rubrobacteraceae bacterium]|nr:S-methyl-5-thioribose-1-phosphate isomerase [Rubrobacteraceae bacterium]
MGDGVRRALGEDAVRTVWWEPGAVCLIDQTKLPHACEVVRCTTVEEVAGAIRSMVVRGAPAIGVTAAYGMALAARKWVAGDRAGLLNHLAEAKNTLDASRPTAFNLSWATARILRVAREGRPEEAVEALAARLLAEAYEIYDEDERTCRAIGEHGAALLRSGTRVLTHCNAGGLATTGYGTALAPIRTAYEGGKALHVFVDETRPFLQGSRLTAWELQQIGIPLTLITDSMAGYFMRRGEVDCIIVGADRVVANGDVANKIGTYGLAVLARAHDIPFYVAAPTSTVDMGLASGEDIPIEQRDPGEVTHLAGLSLAPEGVRAAHPAFDVTPHELVTAIITEKGVVEPPFAEGLRRLLAEPRKSDVPRSSGM